MQSLLSGGCGRRFCAPHYRSRIGASCCATSVARPTPRARRRARTVAVKAERSLYDVLGVPSTANEKEVKRAFRQKALKLHPDVNKAPDAEQRFMEVKAAFSVLSDPQQRADYDRKQRMGAGWGSWRPPSGSSSSGAGAGGYGGYGAGSGRTKQQEEEFYGLGDLVGGFGRELSGWLSSLQQGVDGISSVPGSVAGWAKERAGHIRADGLEDFFRDLEKEADSWSQKRKQSRKEGGKDDRPLSLWEELAAIGEEFVEYLESALPSDDEAENGRGDRSAPSGGTSDGGTGRRRSPIDEYEELKRRYGMDESSTSGSSTSATRGATDSSGSSQARAQQLKEEQQRQQQEQQRQQQQQQAKRKSADEEVDEMLAALKKKLGKS